MKRITLLAALAGLLAASPALALKIFVQMGQRNLARDGFGLTARRLESGAVEFRLTRDLSKSVWPGRSASLETRGEDGKPLSRKLEPEKDAPRGTVAYRFEVPRAQLAGAVLTVSEIQTDRDGHPLVGGGTYYAFRLSGFTAPRP